MENMGDTHHGGLLGAGLSARSRPDHRDACLGSRRAHVGGPQRQSEAFSVDVEHEQHTGLRCWCAPRRQEKVSHSTLE